MSLSDRLMALAPKEESPRILTFDVECAPALAYVWGLHDQNIGIAQVVEPPRLLSFAGKWHHEKRVHYFSEFHHSREEMARESWKMMDAASVVVGYNHVRFDVPWMNSLWKAHGLGPPSPWVDVDLLAINRRRFRSLSNKLAWVTQENGLPAKLETGGQDLWNRCLQGDAKAWATFKRYNVNDVIITEQLFDLYRDQGWITYPHMGQWTRNRECCPHCGGTDLDLVGLVYGRTTAYPKLLCLSCHGYVKVLRNGDTRAL